MDNDTRRSGLRTSAAITRTRTASLPGEVRTTTGSEEILDEQIQTQNRDHATGLANLRVPGDELTATGTPLRRTANVYGSPSAPGPQIAPTARPFAVMWQRWIISRLYAWHALAEQERYERVLLDELVCGNETLDGEPASISAWLERLAPGICDCAGVYSVDKTVDLPAWQSPFETHNKIPSLQKWAETLSSTHAGNVREMIYVSKNADAVACPLFSSKRHLGWLLLGYNTPLRMLGRHHAALFRKISKHLSDTIWRMRQRAELEQVKIRRRELAERVFHEINNPLSAMLMSTSQMMRTKSEHEVVIPRHTLASLHQTAMRIRQVLQDVQQLHKWEEDAFPLQKSHVAIADLFTEVRQQVEPRLSEKSIDLKVSHPVDFECLQIDPVRTSQVLVNLLCNAISATPQGKWIQLWAESADELCRFHVQDSGPGIPVEESLHIFETKWRGTNTTATGAGLGLPIARSIVEAHGGVLRLQHGPEGGAHFVVELPMKPAPLTCQVKPEGSEIGSL